MQDIFATFESREKNSHTLTERRSKIVVRMQGLFFNKFYIFIDRNKKKASQLFSQDYIISSKSPQVFIIQCVRFFVYYYGFSIILGFLDDNRCYEIYPENVRACNAKHF